MSFIWRNTRLYRLFLHAHNQNSIRMNWSGWKKALKTYFCEKEIHSAQGGDWTRVLRVEKQKHKPLSCGGYWWKLAHNRSIHFTAHYYSLQRNWLMKNGMDNVEYWYPHKSNLFTSLGPCDACQLLMAIFWHAFFRYVGSSGLLQSGGGPWSPHNKHRTTNEGHLPDEVLVYIDFFSIYALRMA